MRFRKTLVVQGQDPSSFPFEALFYSWGTYLSLAANSFLVFFPGHTCFLHLFNSTDFVINYILLPIFVLFVRLYRFWTKPRTVRLEDIDIWTGRRERVDSEESESPKKTAKSWSNINSAIIG